MRAVAVASMYTTIGMLPAFLLGALGVSIGRQFGSSPLGLGAGVASFHLVSAIASPGFGRMADTVGANRLLRIGAGVTSLGLLGGGLMSRGWMALAACLALAGLGNAVVQPAANVAVSRGVLSGDQGRAFGVKQAAVPLAALVAGASVPFLAAHIGWRNTFVVSGIAAASAVLVARPLHSGGGSWLASEASNSPRADLANSYRSASMQDGVSLKMLALAGFFGSGASTSLAVFLVPAVTVQGWSEPSAGKLLMVASLSGIVVRLLGGWLIDLQKIRSSGGTACLMALGGLGFLVLAIWPLNHAAHVVGTVLGLGAGWGWAGMYHYLAMKFGKASPGTATGVIMVGVWSGAVVFPLSLGVVIDVVGYRVPWVLSAAAMILAASLVLLSTRQSFGARGTRIP